MLVRLKNVHRVVAGGKVYHYHRLTRDKLSGVPGSPEFTAQVHACDRKAKRASRAISANLGGLLRAYRTSPEYLGLARNTKKNYDRCLKVLDTLADMPISAVDGAFALGLRDREYAKSGRSQANMMVVVIGVLWRWGRPRNLTHTSPIEGINPIPRPKGLKMRNRRWRPEELAQWLRACPHANINLAVVLASQTGLRASDVVGLRWDQFDGRTLAGTQGKTGDEFFNVCTPTLLAALDAAPRLGETIVTKQNGAPFTEANFSAYFSKLNAQLVEDGLVAKGLTFHGLRHTVGAELADAGADTRTIMATTGHKTESSVSTYTRDADRRRGAERAAELLGAVKASVKTQNNDEKSTA